MKTYWMTAFRYVVPADYEQWFEKLASQGWHPRKVGQWSSLAMRFFQGEPNKYRYVVDMQPFPRKEYKQMYEEFGWEFVGQMASMMVWRREYTDERPESFSDSDSRKLRNRRFIGAVAVSFALFLLGALASLGAFIFTNTENHIDFGIMSVFLLVLAVLLGIVMLKMRKNIDK